jgi:CDP-glucose 4,6-dehydratase
LRDDEGRDRITNHESRIWLDRPVFVTGCTGLVGAWLVKELLDARAHVVGLVRDQVAGSNLRRLGLDQRIDIVHGCVEDEPLLERALGEYEIRTVFHLAAQTIVGIANRNPLSTFESNIRGTWNLLEAARRSPTVEQIVVASSDKAYGDQPVLPYTEETPLVGRHPYDVSKSCADLLCLAYHQTFGLPVCVTRCGNFYGGGDLNWNRLVPGTIRSVLRGQRPVIRSDGSLIRDYFYVRDGARAYMCVAERMAAGRPGVVGEAFNFSNETQQTVIDLTRRVLRLMKSDLEPDIRAEARNEILHQSLSAEKAKRVLGWSPQWDLDSSLVETIQWYRDFLAA